MIFCFLNWFPMQTKFLFKSTIKLKLSSLSLSFFIVLAFAWASVLNFNNKIFLGMFSECTKITFHHFAVLNYFSFNYNLAAWYWHAECSSCSLFFHWLLLHNNKLNFDQLNSLAYVQLITTVLLVKRGFSSETIANFMKYVYYKQNCVWEHY